MEKNVLSPFMRKINYVQGYKTCLGVHFSIDFF